MENLSEQSLLEGQLIAEIGRIVGLSGPLEAGPLIRQLKCAEEFACFSAFKLSSLIKQAVETGELIQFANPDGTVRYQIATPTEKKASLAKTARKTVEKRVRHLPPLMSWESRACLLWGNLPGTTAAEKSFRLSDPPWLEAGQVGAKQGSDFVEFLGQRGVLRLERNADSAEWTLNPNTLTSTIPSVRAVGAAIIAMQSRSYEPIIEAKAEDKPKPAPRLKVNKKKRLAAEFKSLPQEIRDVLEIKPHIPAPALPLKPEAEPVAEELSAAIEPVERESMPAAAQCVPEVPTTSKKSVAKERDWLPVMKRLFALFPCGFYCNGHIAIIAGFTSKSSFYAFLVKFPRKHGVVSLSPTVASKYVWERDPNSFIDTGPESTQAGSSKEK